MPFTFHLDYEDRPLRPFNADYLPVLRLLVHGFTIDEIAMELDLPTYEIKLRLLALRQHLNCATLAQACAVAVWEGLVTYDEELASEFR